MENDNNKSKDEKQVNSEKIKEKIRSKCEETIRFCTEQEGEDFYSFEKSLIKRISQLGCLFIQLFLIAYHEKLSCEKWLATGLYYAKKIPIFRTLKTIYGNVEYCRTYLEKKQVTSRTSGFYPLDAILGLTSDGFTPLVMSLVTKLATRVSFHTATLLFRYFYDWAPSTEAVETLVLGMGRQASSYMELTMPPEGDGEILIIECDGKATPTATEEELRKRRGKRKKKSKCCQRHRGKNKRKQNKRNRRKKGDKSKNGRSTTIVVMYTLKIGKDGKLHGPINKIVWASYASRRIMLAWARRQATKRGFPPDTKKRIHIVIDGEKCLYNYLSELFPNATFALDIRHVEEKLWDIARLFYPEDSEEIKQWIDEKRTLLYTGKVLELIKQLKELRNGLSKRAKRDQIKYNALSSIISYLEPRVNMMDYKKLIDEDLPIASGIVEGAARYVVGERMDCSGMRWIPGRAEALLHLRCIELNGDWDRFFQWSYDIWIQKLQLAQKVLVRNEQPIDLSLYTESLEPFTSLEESYNVA